MKYVVPLDIKGKDIQMDLRPRGSFSAQNNNNQSEYIVN